MKPKKTNAKAVPSELVPRTKGNGRNATDSGANTDGVCDVNAGVSSSSKPWYDLTYDDIFKNRKNPSNGRDTFFSESAFNFVMGTGPSFEERLLSQLTRIKETVNQINSDKPKLTQFEQTGNLSQEKLHKDASANQSSAQDRKVKEKVASGYQSKPVEFIKFVSGGTTGSVSVSQDKQVESSKLEKSEHSDQKGANLRNHEEIGQHDLTSKPAYKPTDQHVKDSHEENIHTNTCSNNKSEENRNSAFVSDGATIITPVGDETQSKKATAERTGQTDSNSRSELSNELKVDQNDPVILRSANKSNSFRKIVQDIKSQENCNQLVSDATTVSTPAFQDIVMTLEKTDIDSRTRLSGDTEIYKQSSIAFTVAHSLASTDFKDCIIEGRCPEGSAEDITTDIDPRTKLSNDIDSVVSTDAHSLISIDFKDSIIESSCPKGSAEYINTDIDSRTRLPSYIDSVASTAACSLASTDLKDSIIESRCPKGSAENINNCDLFVGDSASSASLSSSKQTTINDSKVETPKCREKEVEHIRDTEISLHSSETSLHAVVSLQPELELSPVLQVDISKYSDQSKCTSDAALELNMDQVSKGDAQVPVIDEHSNVTESIIIKESFNDVTQELCLVMPSLSSDDDDDSDSEFTHGLPGANHKPSHEASIVSKNKVVSPSCVKEPLPVTPETLAGNINFPISQPVEPFHLHGSSDAASSIGQNKECDNSSVVAEVVSGQMVVDNAETVDVEVYIVNKHSFQEIQSYSLAEQSGQVSTFDLNSEQVLSTDLSPSIQITICDMNDTKISSLNMNNTQVSSCDLNNAQVSSCEINTAQVSSDDLKDLKVSLCVSHSTQVSSYESNAAQVSLSNPNTTQVSSCDANNIQVSSLHQSSAPLQNASTPDWSENDIPIFSIKEASPRPAVSLNSIIANRKEAELKADHVSQDLPQENGASRENTKKAASFRKSDLTKAEHETYLKLYNKYVKSFAQGGLPPLLTQGQLKEINIFEKLQKRVQAEQAEFQNYLFENAKKNPNSYMYLKTLARNYATSKAQSYKWKLKSVSRYNQDCLSEIPLYEEEASCLDLRFHQTLLEAGVPPGIKLPDTQAGNKPVPIPYDIQKLDSSFPRYSKRNVPGYIHHEQVSLDQNVKKLAEKYDFQVVMSSSVIKCLLDNHGPAFDRAWNIPFYVSQMEFGGKVRKIVYLDKPFFQNDFIMKDFSAVFHKYALRTFVSHPKKRAPDMKKLFHQAIHTEPSSATDDPFDIFANVENLETFGAGCTKLVKKDNKEVGNEKCEEASSKNTVLASASDDSITNNETGKFDRILRSKKHHKDFDMVSDSFQIFDNIVPHNKVSAKMQGENTGCYPATRKRCRDDKSDRTTNTTDGDHELAGSDSDGEPKSKQARTENLTDCQNHSNNVSMPEETGKVKMIQFENPLNITLPEQPHLETDSPLSPVASLSPPASPVPSNQDCINNKNVIQEIPLSPVKDIPLSTDKAHSAALHQTPLPQRSSPRKRISRMANTHSPAGSSKSWKQPTGSSDSAKCSIFTPLDSILGPSFGLDNGKNRQITPIEDPSHYLPTTELHSSLVYCLWSLGDSNILIRTRCHGVLKDLKKTRNVYFSPKIEYQTTIGLEQVTVNEMVRDWTSCFIRPNTHLLRARINAFTSEVLMFEELEPDQILRPSLNFNPESGFQFLDRVIQSALSLKCGKYLLSHESGESVCGIRSMKTSYARENAKPFPIKRSSRQDQLPWIPIDPTIVLPFHILSSRIPATFLPKDFEVRNHHPGGPKKNHNRNNQTNNNSRDGRSGHQWKKFKNHEVNNSGDGGNNRQWKKFKNHETSNSGDNSTNRKWKKFKKQRE